MSYDVIASQPIVIDNVSCDHELLLQAIRLALHGRGLVSSKLALLVKITQRSTSTACE